MKRAEHYFSCGMETFRIQFFPKIPKSRSFSFEKIAASAGGTNTAAAESSPPKAAAASDTARTIPPTSFWGRRLLSERAALLVLTGFPALLELTVILRSLFISSNLLAFDVVIPIVPFGAFWCVQMFCTFVLIYIIEHRFDFVKDFWKICSHNFS